MALFSNIVSLFDKTVPDVEQHASQDDTKRADTMQETPPQNPPVFNSDRIFYQAGFRNQNPGWYFNARGGTIQGPFISRNLTIVHLNTYISHCRQRQDTAERT